MMGFVFVTDIEYEALREFQIGDFRFQICFRAGKSLNFYASVTIASTTIRIDPTFSTY